LKSTAIHAPRLRSALLTRPASGDHLLVPVIDQVQLGASGLHVSRLALGMMSFGDRSQRAWILDEAAAEPIVRRAIDSGFTFFDTADMYATGASEVVTGRLLRKLIPRDEAVIATKVFYPTTPGPNGRGLSRKHILSAIDASLARRHRVSPAQVALAWLLSKPGVTAPVIGATSPAHVDDAVAATALELNADEIALLEGAYVPRWPDDE
jgi:aryl-alcohol dehydrogenase-like predicted oxidoreductase